MNPDLAAQPTLLQRCDSQARHGRRRAGNAGDMQPAGRRSNSDFYGLRLKPELLTVLRHAGIDLLAYDGTLCSEIASPLAEAALRIEGDPGLRALFRSVVGCDDGVASEVTETSGGSPGSALSARPSRLESGPRTTIHSAQNGMKHLIRRLCHAHPLPAHPGADLLKCCSPVRSRWQR